MKYTIALQGDMLMACEPDGEDIHAAVKDMEAQIDSDFPGSCETVIETGLILTDHEEYGEVIYESGRLGRLMDENGKEFKYAVKENIWDQMPAMEKRVHNKLMNGAFLKFGKLEFEAAHLREWVAKNVPDGAETEETKNLMILTGHVKKAFHEFEILLNAYRD